MFRLIRGVFIHYLFTLYYDLWDKHPSVMLCTTILTRNVAIPSATKGGSYSLFEQSLNGSMFTQMNGIGLAALVWIFLPSLRFTPPYNDWADQNGYSKEYARFTA